MYNLLEDGSPTSGRPYLFVHVRRRGTVSVPDLGLLGVLPVVWVGTEFLRDLPVSFRVDSTFLQLVNFYLSSVKPP